uniref:Immunoglobulin like and fibronectin type III domain containing 1, tandem duplicate 2 n=1 Tax=Oncorhynchus kisutch TaxID=8019 RepID=A0A8C7EYV2_ONCKI
FFKRLNKLTICFRTSTVAIKRRSRVPGVMITQFVEEVPEGMSTPDFTRKPIALTIQEGKLAFFKSMVSGVPKPNITWARNKGPLEDPVKYISRYDETMEEYFLEIPNVRAEQADTYKCFAANEYGRAVCTATLNVIEGPKRAAPEDFRKMVVRTKPQLKKKEGEIDPKFWEVLLSSPKKDYEKVCMEYGVSDFRWMLKQLNLKKKEREEEQAKVVEKLENLKHIEVKRDGSAEFELDMELKNPNSQVFLFKDGVMVPYSDDGSGKHNLNKIGKKYIFSINDLMPDDAGLYQVDVEDANCFSTDFKIIPVEFVVKIQEVKAKEREDAMFECVLSHPFQKIVWTGKKIPLEQGDKFDITVSEDHLIHSLKVKDCAQLDKGVYTAMAGITSCNAWLIVEADNDPNMRGGKASRKTTTAGGGGENLAKIAAEQSAKLQKEKDDLDAARRAQSEKDAADAARRAQAEKDAADAARRNCEGVWLKDGQLLTNEDGLKIIQDGASHKLVIENCKKDDAGVYSFEVDGHKSEAKFTVSDPPTFNMDSLREFSKPVIVRACETAEWKLAFSGGDPMKIKWIKEDEELLEGLNVKIEQTDIKAGLCITDCQRRNCGEIKINIKNDYGTLEATSRLIVLDKPTPPQRPVEIVETSLTAIEFKWKPPKDDGGCPVKHYILERQQVGGSKTWTNVGELPNDPLKYRDTNVKPGKRYCYHIRAKNEEGVSNALETEDIQAGILCYPGPPSAPKVVSAFKDCINLVWSPPINTGGTETWGYNLERRKKGSNFWSPANLDGPIKDTTFALKDVTEGAAYEFRVSAINISGVGEPSPPSVIVFARDPKMRPQFTGKMKSFMVVRKGNTVRFNINFEASPLPDIYWLKDCVPLSKRVTITNSDRGSQLLIPTSERSDTGIFTIIVKNMVGQETFSVEIRVTDDPKPPGPVELEQNVPGTVTVTWTPSPDEKKDDRLHYVVYKRDSVKRTWRMVADSLFNHKFTVINILPGREYNFRVFAKNDMGLSEPAVSPTWKTTRRKGHITEKYVKGLDLQCPPSFLLRLKICTAPPGYECYMSCAVRGDPKPHVTWYHNNVSLNTNTNYLITNVCGVCTMLILKIGPKDSGEYSVIADSPLGRAECSTKLTVRGSISQSQHNKMLFFCDRNNLQFKHQV